MHMFAILSKHFLCYSKYHKKSIKQIRPTPKSLPQFIFLWDQVGPLNLGSMSRCRHFASSFNGLVVLFFWAIFLYYACSAIQKYLSEPVSTDITLTLGDEGTLGKNGPQYSYPVLSFCNHYIVEDNQHLSACFGEFDSYGLTLIKSCLNKSQNFDVQEMISSLSFKWSDYFEPVKILQKGKEISLDNENLWRIVWTYAFGPCIQLNLKKDETWGRFSLPLPRR